MNTATKLVRMADGKSKVTGRYYGVEFTGQVESSRQLNWGPDYPEQARIVLDAPITVFGGETNVVLINSREVDEQEHELQLA